MAKGTTPYCVLLPFVWSFTGMGGHRWLAEALEPG